MANRWGNNGKSDRLYFPGLQNHCRQELQPWNEKMLLGMKAMTNLESTLKSRDITVPTKVHIVKAVVFPVVMYGCESWTVKGDWVLKNWYFWTVGLGKTPLRVPWTARRSNDHILKEISPEYSLEGLMLKLQYFGRLMWRTYSLEKPWCWESLRVGEEGNRRWGGSKASLTQWTWTWANSRRWWRTGKSMLPAIHGFAKSQTRLSDWKTKVTKFTNFNVSSFL